MIITYTSTSKNQLKCLLIIPMLALAFSTALGQKKTKTTKSRIVSTVDSSHNNELVLIQEFIVNTSLEATWDAYTTKEGWENWATEIAEIDLKVGGLIQTNYYKNGKIGDSTTIRIHIINYVPQKLITFQAEITDNFPEFMKKEAQDFYNVIYFEKIKKNKTRIQSYGIGYKKTPKYLSLLKFFISGNEHSLEKLITYLETKKAH